MEVFDAVRAVWPEEKPLGMRLSATDWADGGWTLEDTVVLAERLKARGCDYVTASSGGTVPGVASPLRFSKTPVNDKVAPPMLGEHTREVLARVLGLDEAELDALEAGGAVQSRKG